MLSTTFTCVKIYECISNRAGSVTCLTGESMQGGNVITSIVSGVDWCTHRWTEKQRETVKPNVVRLLAVK